MRFRKWSRTTTGVVAMAIVVVVAAIATAGAGPKGPKDPKGPKGPKPPATEAPAPTETQDPDPEPEPVDPDDAQFVQMMIPHHHQAVLMSELVSGRAADQAVVALADRILVEQGVEIDTMQFWQQVNGQTETDPESAYAGMLDMPMMLEQMGMASPAEMDQLAASSGAAFDRLYLELMIEHHEGAVRMLEQLLTNGSDQFLSAMGTDMMTAQSTQIWQMEQMLAGMG